LLVVFPSLIMSGCGGDDNGDDRAFVTIQGRADDGIATSPIANAQCRFIERNGNQFAATTADRNGNFRFDILPDMQGFIGCHPPGLSNLVLLTFVSTVGIAAGETFREEVSPRTTAIANIIVQTAPADPQARKAELLAALAAQDPDVTTVADAATELFNALLQNQITDIDFSSSNGESSGESGEGGEGNGGGSSGGATGEAGDGTEFSPLANAQCEFILDPRGETALEDFLLDGSLELPGLQPIAADVKQDAGIKEAFVRLFPRGMQPLVNGQPLWTTTDVNGAYFLPVPPHTPGFVRCAAAPNLAISTFVPARQTGETLTDRHVTPASLVFTAFILPQLTSQDVQAVENNFLTDVGNLKIPDDGLVRVETVATPEGQVIADTDGDGLVCSLRINSLQEGAIDYAYAGATSYTAIALFKALLIEARNPASVSYEAILADVLTRTDHPFIEVLTEDLLAGGVPADRATELAARLNECIRFEMDRIFDARFPRFVRTGRFRVAVRDITTGAPVPNVWVGGVGRFTADSLCRDAQGGEVPPIVLEDNLIVCHTDENGRITFILEGVVELTATPVEWSIRTNDGATLLGVVNADFVPVVTVDAVVPVPLP
jgi:hypothetical protein